MNTTQNTQKGARRALIITAFAAALGVGLGGCATNATNATNVGFAERGSSDLSHEVTRAENRVRADGLRLESPHTQRDQLVRDTNDLANEVTRAENRVQADRSPTLQVNDNDPRGFHGLPSVR